MPAEKEKKTEASFPAIEELIASEDLSGVRSRLMEAHGALDRAGKEKGGLGKASDARKAMRAIEKCLDLLKELLRMKQETAGKMGPEKGGPKSGETKPQRKS